VPVCAFLGQQAASWTPGSGPPNLRRVASRDAEPAPDAVGTSSPSKHDGSSGATTAKPLSAVEGVGFGARDTSSANTNTGCFTARVSSDPSPDNDTEKNNNENNNHENYNEESIRNDNSTVSLADPADELPRLAHPANNANEADRASPTPAAGICDYDHYYDFMVDIIIQILLF
jgi:hypothetical protein